jgi:CHRD domain
MNLTKRRSAIGGAALLATTSALAAGAIALQSPSGAATRTVVMDLSAASAQGRSSGVRERLSGYAEDPAVSTMASGGFWLEIDEKDQELRYVLHYTGLEGTVTQAHIHFGDKHQSGGISAYLCSNLGNGPAGTQACPEAPGKVTGTLTAANVIGPEAQGIAPGEMAELIAAIGVGTAYVNVHSTKFPAGEIRSQLEDDDDHDHDDDHDDDEGHDHDGD